MFCPNCGKPVSGSCCPECGTPLGTSIFLRPYIPTTSREKKQLFKLVLELAFLAPVIAVLTFMAGGALFIGLLFLLVRNFF
ncbi:MAG: hypothetical protein ACPL5F_01820 [Moorellaceae bacterium]